MKLLATGIGGEIVAVTEAQQTQRALTALIGLLLVVAAMLALLTLWYWRHTNPRRKLRQGGAEFDEHGFDPSYDQPAYDQSGYDPHDGGPHYYSPDEAVGLGDSFTDAHR